MKLWELKKELEDYPDQIEVIIKNRFNCHSIESIEVVNGDLIFNVKQSFVNACPSCGLGMHSSPKVKIKQEILNLLEEQDRAVLSSYCQTCWKELTEF